MQHVDNATYYLDACRVIIFYRQDHAPYGIKKKTYISGLPGNVHKMI
jgi:hypothetical protein